MEGRFKLIDASSLTMSGIATFRCVFIRSFIYICVV